MKNILISGGAGFIGSNLALRLIDKGYIVSVLDNLSEQIHGKNPEITSPLYSHIKDRVSFIKGSVTNRNDWIKALKNQEAIIHLAAETGTGQSMYKIEKYTHVNIGGTALLLDILANTKHCIKKVLIASSRAIYGEGKYFCLSHKDVFPLSRTEEDLSHGDFDCKCPICGKQVVLTPTTEDSILHPSSVYGITKHAQEQMIMTICPNIGIVPVSLRYQNVFGAGQSLSNPYTGVLSVFSTRIKNGNEINIFEDGRESRDFIYIDDIVEASVLGLEKQQANGHVFNVGTGKPIDIRTVVDILVEKYKMPVKIQISGHYRLGDIRHNFADTSKIKNILGFQPKYTFEQGIQKFIDWVNQQETHEDYYEKSIQEMKEKGLYK